MCQSALARAILPSVGQVAPPLSGLMLLQDMATVGQKRSPGGDPEPDLDNSVRTRAPYAVLSHLRSCAPARPNGLQLEYDPQLAGTLLFKRRFKASETDASA